VKATYRKRIHTKHIREFDVLNHSDPRSLFIMAVLKQYLYLNERTYYHYNII